MRRIAWAVYAVLIYQDTREPVCSSLKDSSVSGCTIELDVGYRKYMLIAPDEHNAQASHGNMGRHCLGYGSDGNGQPGDAVQNAPFEGLLVVAKGTRSTLSHATHAAHDVPCESRSPATISLPRMRRSYLSFVKNIFDSCLFRDPASALARIAYFCMAVAMWNVSWSGPSVCRHGTVRYSETEGEQEALTRRLPHGRLLIFSTRMTMTLQRKGDL